jgi:hypothetical protein
MSYGQATRSGPDSNGKRIISGAMRQSLNPLDELGMFMLKQGGVPANAGERSFILWQTGDPEFQTE